MNLTEHSEHILFAVSRYFDFPLKDPPKSEAIKYIKDSLLAVRRGALEEAAKDLETYGLQLYREVENYPLSRAGAATII